MTEGKSNYGYGWEITRERDAQDERWIRHGGGINGFMSYAVWIPERKVFVAVLSNAMGGGNPGQLCATARARSARPRGRNSASRSRSMRRRSTDTSACTRSRRAFKLTVTREGQRVFVQGTNQPKGEIFAEAEGKFFAKDVDAQFEFDVEGDRATSLTLYQNGRSIVAKRVEE